MVIVVPKWEKKPRQSGEQRVKKHPKKEKVILIRQRRRVEDIERCGREKAARQLSNTVRRTVRLKRSGRFDESPRHWQEALRVL